MSLAWSAAHRRARLEGSDPSTPTTIIGAVPAAATHVTPSVVDLVDGRPSCRNRAGSIGRTRARSGAELLAQVVEGPAQCIHLGAQLRQLGTQLRDLVRRCRLCVPSRPAGTGIAAIPGGGTRRRARAPDRDGLTGPPRSWA